MQIDSNQQLWNQATNSYQSLTNSRKLDSEYLRRKGLYNNILKMAGDCTNSVVLDVGSGTGWLMERLLPYRGCQSDIASYSSQNDKYPFSVQDARHLAYRNDTFDLVVSSLVLIWIQEIDQVCYEFWRVTKPNGRLIISLVHPYFYRTGTVTEHGDFIIHADLSKEFSINRHFIAGEVGPFTYYYRSLDTYINYLIQSGWSITQMKDWFIDMNDYYKDNSIKTTAITRTGKVPMYTFIECLKNG
ncbi:MAG: class I SAM-dependent methyltransferase [Chloroflexota bacterium]